MDNCNSIEFLRMQFLCCIPMNKFIWPELINNIDEDVQKQIIDITVNCELLVKYPIKESYKKAFLKSFINKLENSGVDINDEVYNTYCDAVAIPDKQSIMHFRHFILNTKDVNDILSIKESANIISEGTTGLCSWKAAFYLAEWCIVNKQKIQGKRILELGSGVGLTGLTVVNLCTPKLYYFSDCHPIVLKILEENLRLNLVDKKKKLLWKEILANDRIRFEKIGTEIDVEVEMINLKWEEINKRRAEQLEVDLVIAADVLYDNSTFESLASSLKELMCGTVSYAIVAATVRNECTISEFLNFLDKYDLAYEEETTSMPQIFLESEDTPIRILKIFRQIK